MEYKTWAGYRHYQNLEGRVKNPRIILFLDQKINDLTNKLHQLKATDTTGFDCLDKKIDTLKLKRLMELKK